MGHTTTAELLIAKGADVNAMAQGKAWCKPQEVCRVFSQTAIHIVQQVSLKLMQKLTLNQNGFE
jgi:hypothetical protein